MATCVPGGLSGALLIDSSFSQLRQLAGSAKRMGGVAAEQPHEYSWQVGGEIRGSGARSLEVGQVAAKDLGLEPLQGNRNKQR